MRETALPKGLKPQRLMPGDPVGGFVKTGSNTAAATLIQTDKPLSPLNNLPQPTLPHQDHFLS